MSSIRTCYLAALLAACSSPGPSPTYDPPRPATPWLVPDGWKHELIPFPLGFAPSLPYAGVEEIRFAPGFFKPAEPGYWAYAFVWRLEGDPPFDAATISADLTTYFRGLVDAVDEKKQIADRESIVVRATAGRVHVVLTATLIDPFTTKQPVELVGAATRTTCPSGALWVFVVTPTRSPMRAEVDALAARATCGQPPVPNATK